MIRNFAKSLENWLISSMSEMPSEIMNIKVSHFLLYLCDFMSCCLQKFYRCYIHIFYEKKVYEKMRLKWSKS